jgi:hypothetical protein
LAQEQRAHEVAHRHALAGDEPDLRLGGTGLVGRRGEDV